MASTVRPAQATSPSRLATPPGGSTHEETAERRTGAAVTGQGTGQGVHWRDRTAPSATVDSRHNVSPHSQEVPVNATARTNRVIEGGSGTTAARGSAGVAEAIIDADSYR